ncbi:MAG: class I SAM-dependent methyltransferase [Candidatus Pacebacteria bacterium]|nr:class I SAM-dependent methyltransferase [Candidatus Paceibacterota bacterium]
MERIYTFDTALASTHSLILERVPEKTKVLEIGTASGYLGEYLIHEKKCSVWGVEPERELYEDAQRVGYEKLFNETVEAFLECNYAQKESFNVLLLADVLEHMARPDGVLVRLVGLLKEGGHAVISLPNVANYAIRWQLLTGRWDPQDAGIMDKTHLHFYTKKTIKNLIERSGLIIESMRPAAGHIERFGKRKLLGIGKKLLFLWPEFFATQFVVVARKKAE